MTENWCHECGAFCEEDAECIDEENEKALCDDCWVKNYGHSPRAEKHKESYDAHDRAEYEKFRNRQTG